MIIDPSWFCTQPYVASRNVVEFRVRLLVTEIVPTHGYGST
jgi:hypothetical protein